MDLDDIIDLNQAAELLGLKPVTLRAHAAAGRIAAKQLTKTWITTRQEVERFRQEQRGQLGRPKVIEIALVPWVNHRVQRGSLRIIGFEDTKQEDREAVMDVAADSIAAGARTVTDIVNAARMDARTGHLVLTAQDGAPNAPTLGIARGRRVFAGQTSATGRAYDATVLAVDGRSDLRQSRVKPTREPGT